MVVGSCIPSQSVIEVIPMISLLHFERLPVSLYEKLGNLVDTGSFSSLCRTCLDSYLATTT